MSEAGKKKQKLKGQHTGERSLPRSVSTSRRSRLYHAVSSTDLHLEPAMVRVSVASCKRAVP